LSECDEKLLDSKRLASKAKELLARHESELEGRHAAVRDLESELGRVNGELDQVKNELGQVTEERSRLISELEQTRHRLADSEGRLRGAKRELNCVRSELNRVTDELAEFYRKANESRTHQAELREAKQRSDDLCHALSTDLENMKVKLAEAESRLATTKKSEEILEERLTTSVLLRGRSQNFFVFGEYKLLVLNMVDYGN